MKREEAQFILTAYRANGEDALNPDFGESLRMAESDPELAQWFAQEQAMDRLICEKLREVQPPAELRDLILMGGRVSRRSTWFRVAKWMSLAAALLLFSLLGSYYLRAPGGDDFSKFAIHYVSAGFDLQSENHDLAQLKSWLSSRNMPTPASLPDALAALGKIGCRTANFQGRNVSIICFEGDGEYHLFIARRQQPSLLASVSGKKIFSQGKWTTAAWSDRENDYVLATEENQKALERLL